MTFILAACLASYLAGLATLPLAAAWHRGARLALDDLDDQEPWHSRHEWDRWP